LAHQVRRFLSIERAVRRSTTDSVPDDTAGLSSQGDFGEAPSPNMRERARSCEALCECANAEPERVNVRPESANGRPAFANVVLGRCYPAFMSSLPIHIFSDIACPWCYVGKRRLEAALERFEHRDAVTITWRSFELDPSAPRVADGGVSYAARLAKKYGVPMQQAETMLQRMTDAAKADGIEMRFDRIQPGNTFDAHRLLHLASKRNRQDALKERLFFAYFTEGEAIGDTSVLQRLATEVGLDADEVASVLHSDSHAADVRADQEQARSAGISGVPFFIIGRYGVSGAQPADVLLEVLGRAWAELPKDAVTNASEGETCGPEGCD